MRGSKILGSFQVWFFFHTQNPGFSFWISSGFEIRKNSGKLRAILVSSLSPHKNAVCILLPTFLVPEEFKMEAFHLKTVASFPMGLPPPPLFGRVNKKSDILSVFTPELP